MVLNNIDILKMQYEKSSNFSRRIKCIIKRTNSELKRNNELTTIPRNSERCFIVCNGPSLLTQDLTFLKNEFVFTLHSIYRSEKYNEFNSHIHLVIDINYFSNAGLEELINILTLTKPFHGYVIPLKVKSIIEKAGLEKVCPAPIYYMNSNQIFHEQYKRKLDMTKDFPGFQTVTLSAVATAIYMGFKEIYLIGCDMTFYKELSNNPAGKNSIHAYQEDKTLNKIFHEAYDNENNPDTIELKFKACGYTFEQYRRMKEYCTNKNIAFINATNGGLLHSLPRVDFESLFIT